LKLIYSPFSPFARKVRVVLAEKGLEEQVEGLVVDPMLDPPALTDHNPISQVPALILADGTALFDSPVICGYLDSLSEAPRLLPSGDDHWRVRRAEASADGIMELAVKLRQEALRPESHRSPDYIARWRRCAVRALDALERTEGSGGLDLGEIALVVALDYVDFRQPDLDWRAGRPNLLARWRRLEARPSFRATAPA
jgi:glutathione S-transferase